MTRDCSTTAKARQERSDASQCVIGLDFGTESLRALLVNTGTGEEVAEAAARYEHGVIGESLPESGVSLGRDWALQHPADYLKAIYEAIPLVLRKGQVDGVDVTGIGIDFTSCTVLPTTHDGTPLCFLEPLKSNPHSWVKLWKHHAAQPEADRINEVASERGECFLKYYGGRVSSEWALPKLLQILNEAPEVYRATARFIEAGDWVAWQLTGEESRNACAAGYKALWNSKDGYPGRDFLRALDPAFEGAVEDKLAGPIRTPGEKAGNLRPEIARALGLSDEVAVASPIIDAHAGVLGCGVAGPDRMVMVMGTSSCQMVMTEEPHFFKGFAGMVQGGILPGYYGYEYGQSAVGDIFAWFVDNCVPYAYYQEATSRQVTLYELLEEKASRLSPGESGLVALDWHNGNRSILMDANLKGMVVGYTLKTKPEEVYRALVEATAFGARRIVEAHESGAKPIKEVFACGGLTGNRMLMGIYADILGKSVKVPSSSQPVALGAAILGALAAAADRGDYSEPAEVVERMALGASALYTPDRSNERAYEKLYARYKQYYDYFGARGIAPA